MKGSCHYSVHVLVMSKTWTQITWFGFKCHPLLVRGSITVAVWVSLSHSALCCTLLWHNMPTASMRKCQICHILEEWKASVVLSYCDIFIEKDHVSLMLFVAIHSCLSIHELCVIEAFSYNEILSLHCDCSNSFFMDCKCQLLIFWLEADP